MELAGLGTGPPVPVIVTRLDLLQGDIRTIFGPGFVTGDYQTLRVCPEIEIPERMAWRGKPVGQRSLFRLWMRRFLRCRFGGLL